MKLIRYGEPGNEKPGVIGSDGDIRVLSSIVPDITGRALASGLVDYLSRIDIDSLPKIQATLTDETSHGDASHGQTSHTRLGPPIADVGKIVICALNYHDHAQEADFPIPEELSFLFKSSTAIVGAADPVHLPPDSQALDWEAELAVVVGKPATRVASADAYQYIAGYTLLNDLSERNYQLNRGPTWTKGKSCDGFAPLGPWLVTPDEIADPHDLALWLEVNGERKQESNTSQLIFSIPDILSTISCYVTLMPGDVIGTGTPGGVAYGQSPQVYLAAHDRIVMGATGLSQQTTEILDAEVLGSEVLGAEI